MIALQNMLIRTERNQIYSVPAWPEKWEVEIKLHIPGYSFIEGSSTGKKGLKISETRVPRTIRIKNCLNDKIIK